MKVMIAKTVLFLLGYGIVIACGAPAWGAVIGGWVLAGQVGGQP